MSSVNKLSISSEHRAKMNAVFSQMLRYVFCPVYNYGASGDIYGQIDLNSLSEELTSVFTCQKCSDKKKTDIVLKQCKFGFDVDDYGVRDFNASYCEKCYKIECDIASIGWDGRGIAPWL